MQSEQSDMKPVLDGITIIDISTGIAGSCAAMLLTDQGADCIKIESKRDNPTRSLPGFHVWNRGKKSVTLNLDTAEGRQVLYQLVKKADVLIQSYSPAQAKNLGLDYQFLSKLNPRLIYCAIPPFGEKGPLSEKPASEGVVAAWGGLYVDQGGLGNSPVFLTIPIASYGTALLVAYGVATALFIRQTSGIGQKVEVPLLSGALLMQASSYIRSEMVTPVPTGQNVQQGVISAYRLYKCRDKWMMLACGNQTFFNKLCIALGKEDLIADPRFENAPWGVVQIDNLNALTAILGDVFRRKPREYWLKLLSDADVPCAPVATREEFMEDPQVQTNQMIISLDDPQVGETRQMGIPLTLTENPTTIKGPAPLLGQHTDEVLKDFGYSDDELGKLRSKGII